MRAACQTAWILNDTVEKNVLFGQPKDEGRYQAALAAAQLLPDLKILPFGDQTEIGERGVTLSGARAHTPIHSSAAHRREPGCSGERST